MLRTALPTHRAAGCTGRLLPKRLRSRFALHSPVVPRRSSQRATRRFRIRSASDPAPVTEEVTTGVVFEPFSEVQVELATVDKTDAVFDSIARSAYHKECEAALNEQINIEYNVAYVYHAIYCYFDRDNVALPGLAEFFKHQSDEEREHAEKCMEYQNMRGGRVKLQGLSEPKHEYHDEKKGDALYAMELALSLEKLNFTKLRELWAVANKHNDAQMCDFIEGELLRDQVDSIKQISMYVSQLRRVGMGHGVFHFDRVFHNNHT